MDRITPCIWYDGDALGAAEFYVTLLPDSRIAKVTRAPLDTPGNRAGDVMMVEFELAGQRFMGLNGGPVFPQTEAVSFVIRTDDQAETDRLWDAIVGNGGKESACGWCKDRWGVNWQVTPRRLLDLVGDADGVVAARAMTAMMTMRRIDIAAIEAAAAGAKA
ncbi:VOC family protein [Sphingomonas sp.]|uniref:VOC family protein n=1 Tax=Sphingomonas sp. TaxID=28214 RepID=UPI002B8C1782|nr:VOC family protein [Sphingomonas sp.]HTG39115.1 VOC family protein [Sphingomonas sp.]